MTDETGPASDQGAEETAPSRDERIAGLLADQVKWRILRDRWKQSLVANAGLAGLGLVLTVGGMLVNQGGFIVFVGAILYGAARALTARKRLRTCVGVLARVESELASLQAEDPEEAASQPA